MGNMKGVLPVIIFICTQNKLFCENPMYIVFILSKLEIYLTLKWCVIRTFIILNI